MQEFDSVFWPSLGRMYPIQDLNLNTDLNWEEWKKQKILQIADTGDVDGIESRKKLSGHFTVNWYYNEYGIIWDFVWKEV